MARQAAPRATESEETAKKKITKEGVQQLLGLFRYIRPYRLKFVAGLLFLFLSSASTLAFTFLIQYLVDAAFKKHGSPPGGFEWLGSVDQVGVLLVGLLAVQAGLSFFRILWFVQVGERALADLRQDVYRRMIEFPMAFFGQRRVGELASRLSSDVSTIQDTFTTTLAEGIRSVINLVVCMGLILYTSVKLTLFMLAMLPVVIVVAIFFGRFIRKISREAQDKLAETNVIVEETLQGIQNVKSFTNELYERTRYGTVLRDFVRIVLRLAVYRGAFASMG